MVFQSYKAITEAAQKESHTASRSSKALADTSNEALATKGQCWLRRSVPSARSSCLLLKWRLRPGVCECVLTGVKLLPKTASVGEAWEPPPMLVSFLFLFFFKQPRQLHASEIEHFSTPITARVLGHHGHEENGDLLHKVWRSMHAECLDANSLWLIIQKNSVLSC